MSGNSDGKCTLLITHCTIGADGLDMERIFTAGKFVEGYTMQKGIPFFQSSSRPSIQYMNIRRSLWL